MADKPEISLDIKLEQLSNKITKNFISYFDLKLKGIQIQIPENIFSVLTEFQHSEPPKISYPFSTEEEKTKLIETAKNALAEFGHTTIEVITLKNEQLIEKQNKKNERLKAAQERENKKIEKENNEKAKKEEKQKKKEEIEKRKQIKEEKAEKRNQLKLDLKNLTPEEFLKKIYDEKEAKKKAVDELKQQKSEYLKNKKFETILEEKALKMVLKLKEFKENKNALWVKGPFLVDGKSIYRVTTRVADDNGVTYVKSKNFKPADEREDATFYKFLKEKMQSEGLTHHLESSNNSKNVEPEKNEKPLANTPLKTPSKKISHTSRKSILKNFGDMEQPKIKKITFDEHKEKIKDYMEDLYDRNIGKPIKLLSAEIKNDRNILSTKISFSINGQKTESNTFEFNGITKIESVTKATELARHLKVQLTRLDIDFDKYIFDKTRNNQERA